MAESIQPWTKQTLARIESLLFSHKLVASINSEQSFTNLSAQYNPPLQFSDVEDTVSRFIAIAALWGLVRVNETPDLEARRQYGLFLNHLQDAQSALVKAIQIHQKTMLTQTIPPTRVVANLPIATLSTTQL